MNGLLRLALAAASASMAHGACSALTAGVNSQITCGAGDGSVTIPAGQYVLFLNVAGGGGGGARFAGAPGAGGAGHFISGYASLPATTASLRMKVGAGGVPGEVPQFGNPGGRGAGGGSGTGLYAFDAGNNLLAVIAVAGGGGGGGGSDEANTGTGNGGDAGLDGSLGGYAGYWEAPPGQGAVGAAAGLGAPITANGAYSPEAGVDGSSGASMPSISLQVGGRGSIYPPSSSDLIDMRGGAGGGGWASGGGGGKSLELLCRAVRCLLMLVPSSF